MHTKIFLIAIALIAITGLAYSLAELGHDFSEGQCSICHTSSQSKEYTMVKISLTQSCLTCHPNVFKEGYMHPVDIKPEHVRIPRDMPLSQNGTITCATCHDVHSDATTRFGSKSHFLRRQESGKAFCDICHLHSPSRFNGHEPVFSSAHFTSKYISTGFGSKIDAMSRDCISCHDGSIGSSVELKSGSWRHQENFLDFDKGGMHPIGMSYEKSRMKVQKAALKPIFMVDKRIRFFGPEKKIGCGSCHNPFSRKKNKLVMSNVRSKLCLACHGMSK